MACEGCTYTFLRLVKKFYEEEEATLDYFKAHGVLPDSVKCPTCGCLCNFKPSIRGFYCSKVRRDEKSRRVRCKFTVSEKKGTFLDKAHLKANDLLTFIALFLSKARTQRDAEDWLGFASDTCVNWASYCYEVCEYWLGSQGAIGGPGVVVEIDESKFGKSKYGRGRDVEGKWVFGAFERGSKKLLLFPVEKRNAQTLTPIIQRHILPGTTIYSDEWRAYSHLGELGYTHATVNHSEHFVSESGVHTQNIERSWRDAKSWVLRSGNKVPMYSKYLARYLFARAYSKSERVHHFLKNAAELYSHPHRA